MSTLKAVRGTRDLLPPETALWNRVEATARAVFARYGFGEIRTPIFEDTQLFVRGVGEETDVVSKEMYTWEDGERFEKQLLLNKWYLANREKFEGYMDSSAVDKAKVDMELDGYDGITELVIFAAKSSKAALEALAEAVSEKRAEYAGFAVEARVAAEAQVIGRLVLPSPNPIGSEEKMPNGLLIETIHGNFFKSSQSLTLRPENTAGVVRAYIEHKLGDTGMLQKLFYIGPQFRRERPQRGRYRQFWQIGAEVLGPVPSGSESPLRDAEVLEMLATLLDELGIPRASESNGNTGWKLALNSVGSATDRPRYIAALREALQPIKATLCEDCQRRADTNPLRVLDCKVPEDQATINGLPKIADYLDEASTAHFAQVRGALDACGVEYTVEPRLVRGLDYYTRTTFEFTAVSGLGTQNALLGGGRYDGLSEMLGGPKAPGIGFAIGEDRLILTLQALAGSETAAEKLDAYIAPMGIAQNAAALALAKELRATGLSVEVGDGGFRLKKSFEIADKLARRIVILGEDEASSNVLTVKTFATGDQAKIGRADLAAALRL